LILIRSKEKKGEMGRKLKKKWGKNLEMERREGGWEKDDDEEERGECYKMVLK
jgi:hypothetical protein